MFQTRATVTALISATILSSGAMAAEGQVDALAKAFGARSAVSAASLSPDGEKIALIAAGPGRSTYAYVVDVKGGGQPVAAAVTSGKPAYLTSCDWVSNDRLTCQTAATMKVVDDVYTATSIFAVNAKGGDIRSLSQRRGANALGYDLRGGKIIDLLPGQDGMVLMTRSYVPEANVNSLISKTLNGLGVDQVDTATGKTKRVEDPNPQATSYISDGRGNVRIIGIDERRGSGYSQGTLRFSYRAAGQRDWRPLSIYDYTDESGFYPIAIDPDKNVAYGYEKTNGKDALVSVTLDPQLTKKVIFAHPKVDVGGVIRVGRERRIVGVSYSVEGSETVYFDANVAALAKSLSKTLGGKAVHVEDISADGNRALIWAGADTDPGQYYLFDRAARKLSPIMPDRPDLAGRTFATMQAVYYKAGDGTDILAYLTLPPGQKSAKNLPAIVLPHGGPQSRDTWGFDWMVQYYAARGFAILQPQFRGSAGFGQEWLVGNGFKSWRTSIGDVVDAGRWLVSQGIADPAKLTIAGWSYGGYAALQAQAIDPTLFKAVVAIAPVTDIPDMVRRSQFFSNHLLLEKYLGSGNEAEAASPTSHAAEFQAPVLMFHGTDDGNVDITQSRIMLGKLQSAGKRSNLVTYTGLEHSLVDSDIRADMLQRSADFLLAAGK